MTSPLKIAVLVGSARMGSLNQALAGALERMAGERMVFDLLPIRELPVYCGDLESDPPEGLWDIKARIEASDGVLFVSPEHNRSVTALMKNAIDWSSRPAGNNSLRGKRAAVCGASPGTRGADMSQMHLRQIVIALALEMMPQPEGYTHMTAESVTAEGDLASEADRRRLGRFLDAFEAWVRR